MKRQYIVLTNNRIIGKYRIVAKNILLSAGGIDKIIFYNILNPEEFKKSVNEEIDINKSIANLNIKQKNISAADEILKLKNLLDEGILTQEEFDVKKKQLLNI